MRFAKGHGTENDFVVLPDLDAQLDLTASVVSALCAAWGGPLVSTSANRAGTRPASAAFQVRRYFGDGVEYVLPGALGAAARPTSIRDLISGQIIRH